MEPISAILNIGTALISRLFPDKEAQDKAKAELFKMQQSGDLKRLEAQVSVMLAEAKSQDKWTSRARPTFLYVIYIMILASLPMGIVSAFDHNLAREIAAGLQEWLGAIPNSLWGLFGVGYTGYVASRSYDKQKQINSKMKLD